MTINWSDVASKAAGAAQSHEDKKGKMVVEVGNALGRIFDANPSDQRLDAVKMILGIIPGTEAELREKLGMAESASESDGPEALPPAPERPLPVFRDDGSKSGVALREAQAIAAGYAHKLDDTGNHVGWQKPPSPDSPTPAPTTPTGGDREVDVKDRKGRVVRHIKVSDGVRDDNLEAELEPDGTVKGFTEKPRLIRR